MSLLSNNNFYTRGFDILKASGDYVRSIFHIKMMHHTWEHTWSSDILPALIFLNISSNAPTKRRTRASSCEFSLHVKLVVNEPPFTDMS
jgi:hypothetical protein